MLSPASPPAAPPYTRDSRPISRANLHLLPINDVFAMRQRTTLSKLTSFAAQGNPAVSAR